MPVQSTCSVCGKVYHTFPSRLRAGRSRCSNRCVYIDKSERMRTPLLTRFLGKVRKDDTPERCWTWTGFRDRKGYGQLTIGSKLNRSRRSDGAHRISWRLHFGEIPDGLCVLHKCDNPPCVNPSHLFLGTSADNVADMIAKGRDVHVLMTGTRNGNAKLDERDIPEIRRLYDQGVPHKDIARRYGVVKTLISEIGRRNAWKHVP